MPTATITADDIIRRYGADIAYVAEEAPATTLDVFADQVGAAAAYFANARFDDAGQISAAAEFLNEAWCLPDGANRADFLRRADMRLKRLGDMAEEYREMVGD
jgi:hypothetical protein